MSDFNKVIIIGNLTRDPETRTMPNGTAICKIGLASNRDYMAADGTKRQDAVFVDCDAFGKTAEAMQKWLKKGRKVLVEGRLKLDQWDDKETGQKRSRMGIVVESFNFVGARDDTPEPSQPQARSEAPKPTSSKPSGIDDDVPF